MFPLHANKQPEELLEESRSSLHFYLDDNFHVSASFGGRVTGWPALLVKPRVDPQQVANVDPQQLDATSLEILKNCVDL